MCDSHVILTCFTSEMFLVGLEVVMRMENRWKTAGKPLEIRCTAAKQLFCPQ